MITWWLLGLREEQNENDSLAGTSITQDEILLHEAALAGRAVDQVQSEIVLVSKKERIHSQTALDYVNFMHRARRRASHSTFELPSRVHINEKVPLIDDYHFML